jgi:argininosuccinate lyase
VNCCEGRTSYGGPTAASVKVQIADALAQADAWEEAHQA